MGPIYRYTNIYLSFLLQNIRQMTNKQNPTGKQEIKYIQNLENKKN